MKESSLSDRVGLLETLSDFFRLEALRVCQVAKSGHIGSACSSAELLTVLYFGGILHYDPDEPRHPGRDRVLIRGHLGPLRYPIFSALGWVDRKHLATYRRVGSILQGHESMHFVPGVDITPSGSLGMCLSYGVGAAVRLAETCPDATVYVFLGDGEEQEGNVTEAARHAASLNLSNLVCVLDWNGKQLSRPTIETEPFLDRAKVWKGFGWQVESINGHSVREIVDAFTQPRTKPLFILAKTTKGFGVPGAAEHQSGYHSYSTCPTDLLLSAIETLQIKVAGREKAGNMFINEIVANLVGKVTRPSVHNASDTQSRERQQVTADPISEPSKDYDEVLQKGLKSLVRTYQNERSKLFILTADWSTNQQSAENGFLEPWVRFVDVGIREQHMMAMAHGIAVTDPEACVIVFDGDAFVYRYADQIHAAAQVGVPVVIITTDAGLCEARNGPTHQSEGQPGVLATMPNIRFFEPADEVDFYTCLNRALKERSHPSYIRTHSAKIQALPGIRNGVAYLCNGNEHKSAHLNVISSGCTSIYAFAAAKEIEREYGFEIRVVNVLEPSSLDEGFIRLLDLHAPLLIVYNGNPAVLSGMVARALAIYSSDSHGRMYECGFLHGTTGTMAEVFEVFGLDEAGIRREILRLIGA